MPRDIRSYFTILSKNDNGLNNSNSSKNEDKKIVNVDNKHKTKVNKAEEKKVNKTNDKKRRRIVAISSDSETELEKTPSKKIFTKQERKSKIDLDKYKKALSDPKKELERLEQESVQHEKEVENTKKNMDKSKKETETLKKELKSQVKKKRISVLDAFGDEPVKQKKVVKKTEFNIHEDDDFEKTLLDLDEDTIINSVNDKSCTSAEDNQKETENYNNNEENTPRKRKAKEDTSCSSQVISDEERFERKRYSAMLYQKYLNRSGPKHLGEKWIPKGTSQSLKGLCFLITGILDSLERDEAQELITQNGGKCIKSISGKVNFVVLGEDAGPSKIEKAKHLGVKMISEDELIDLICTKRKIKNENAQNKEKVKNNDEDGLVDATPPRKEIPSKKRKIEILEKTKKKETSSSKEDLSDNQGKQKIQEDNQRNEQPTSNKKSQKTPEKLATKENLQNKQKMKKELISDDEDIPEETVKNKLDKSVEKIKHKKEQISDDDDDEIPSNTVKDIPKVTEVIKKEKIKSETPTKEHKYIKIEKVQKEEDLSLADKYKPMQLNQIIGQQTDNSNAKKLLNWLQEWQKNRQKEAQGKGAARPSPWAKNDCGAFFKAALLSGPPGVGKTTSAHLAAKQLGFDVIEFNASDTRSKKTLQQCVAEVTHSGTMVGWLHSGEKGIGKQVLVMDEVDGMAGNEDRGGMQELIALIKTTQIPIICLCNDRQSTKVRSLANYCFDLRFAKPRLEQIRGQMMSVCFKEKIPMKVEDVTRLIQATGCDVRQTLNQLQLFKVENNKSPSEKQMNCYKDVKLGPWEVIRKVFSTDENLKFDERCKLFFYDYSLGPLFVQENYLKIKPISKKPNHLKQVAFAANALSMSDIIDSKIRFTQNWGLLNSQAVFSTVAVGLSLQGHFGGQIEFPSILGKISKENRYNRLQTELSSHFKLATGTGRTALTVDYLQYLKEALVTPLLKGNVEQSLDIMHKYYLTKDDFTALVEIGKWGKGKDLFDQVDSKVKASFTRQYNKEGFALPYAAAAVKKKTKTAIDDMDYNEEEAESDEDEDEENDLSLDTMIKTKKPAVKTTSAKASASSSKASSKTSASASKKASAKPRGKRGGK